MASKQYEFDNGIKVDANSVFTGNVSMQANVVVGGDLSVTGNLVFTQASYGNIVPPANNYTLGNTISRFYLYATQADYSANVNFGSLVTLTAANTNQASIRVPHGAAPTSPINGDLWSTTAGFFTRTNGVTRQLAFIDSNISGSANTANALTTARNIQLTGAVTGNVNFDGSANVSITTVLPTQLLITANNINVSNVANVQSLNVLGVGTFYGNTVPTSNGIALGNTTSRWALTASTGDFGTSLTANTFTAIGSINLNVANVASNGQFYIFNSATAGTPASNAGLIINRGSSSNSSFFWDEVADKWKVSVAGTNYLNVVEDGNTYNINISGQALTANNSSNFNGQAASYYTNATNISSGTLSDSRLPSTMSSKTFSSSIAVQGDVSANTITVSNGATISTTVNLNAANVSSNGQFYIFNSGLVGAPSANVGIVVNRGNTGNSSIFWNETAFRWNVTGNSTPYVLVVADANTYNINIYGQAATAVTANSTTYFGGQQSSYYTNLINGKIDQTTANTMINAATANVYSKSIGFAFVMS